MKKTIIALSLVFSLTLIGTAQVQAAGLSQIQISAIISLLQSFGASTSVIANVSASLGGTPIVSTQPTSVTTVGGSSCANLTSDLQLGSQGDAVYSLQSFLEARGYLKTAPTGYFGPLTQVAVEGFQGAQGISNTGVVGPSTRAQIKAMSCTTLTTTTPVSIVVSSVSSAPTTCPFDFSPVCGVDGRTYNNACNAQQLGVQISSSGACGSNPTYTAPSAACAAEATAPVCGTNNVSYANTCSANLNGVSVQYQGECSADLICKPQLECGSDLKTYDASGCGTYPKPALGMSIVYGGACNFTVQTPTITAINGYSSSETVTGGYFNSGDVAYLDGNTAAPIATTFVSGQTLRIVLSSGLSGNHTLQLHSTSLGSGNTFSFNASGAPTITGQSGCGSVTTNYPNYTACQPTNTVTLRGANFTNNSVVIVNYAASVKTAANTHTNTAATYNYVTLQITPTFLSSTGLYFVMPTISQYANSDSFQVMQKDNTSLISNVFNFTYTGQTMNAGNVL